MYSILVDTIMMLGWDVMLGVEFHILKASAIIHILNNPPIILVNSANQPINRVYDVFSGCHGTRFDRCKKITTILNSEHQYASITRKTSV